VVALFVKKQDGRKEKTLSGGEQKEGSPGVERGRKLIWIHSFSNKLGERIVIAKEGQKNGFKVTVFCPCSQPKKTGKPNRKSSSASFDGKKKKNYLCPPFLKLKFFLT
jgi:hypothetical protein